MYSYNRESYADKYRKYLPAIETELDNSYRRRTDTSLSSRYGTRYLGRDDNNPYPKNYDTSYLCDKKSERVLKTIKAGDEDFESLREWCEEYKAPKSENNREEIMEQTIEDKKPCRSECSKKKRHRTFNGHDSKRHRTAKKQDSRRPRTVNGRDLQRPSTSIGKDQHSKKRNSFSSANRLSTTHNPGSPCNRSSRSHSPRSPSKDSVDIQVNCCPTQTKQKMMCAPTNREPSPNQKCAPKNKPSRPNQMCAPKNKPSRPNQMCAPKNKPSRPNQMCATKNKLPCPNQMCTPGKGKINKSPGKSCPLKEKPRRRPQATNFDDGFVQDCCEIFSRSLSPGEGDPSDEDEKQRKGSKFKRFKRGNKKEKELDTRVESELKKIAECFERKREERLSQDPEEYKICIRNSKCKARSREEKFKRKENSSTHEKKKWRKKWRK